MTFHFVVLCRILFRAEDLVGVVLIRRRFLDFGRLIPRLSLLARSLPVVGYVIHFIPTRWVGSLQSGFIRLHSAIPALLVALVTAVCWKMGTWEQFAFICCQF